MADEGIKAQSGSAAAALGRAPCLRAAAGGGRAASGRRGPGGARRAPADGGGREPAYGRRGQGGHRRQLQDGGAGERRSPPEPLHEAAAEQTAERDGAEDEEAQHVADPAEELARDEALAQREVGHVAERDGD